LPTPWVFTADGVFKDETDLHAMAKGVIGKNTSKEVLVYCGVGGYASTWWFLLTQVFGYKNVKLYDGGMAEWMQDPNAPVGIYSWH
jgi:thiosulfate/3-mercaptopyruvate sulfurtransferase